MSQARRSPVSSDRSGDERRRFAESPSRSRSDGSLLRHYGHDRHHGERQIRNEDEDASGSGGDGDFGTRARQSTATSTGNYQDEETGRSMWKLFKWPRWNSAATIEWRQRNEEDKKEEAQRDVEEHRATNHQRKQEEEAAGGPQTRPPEWSLLLALPDEVAVRVLGFLRPCELFACSLVHSQLHRLTADEEVWRQLVERKRWRGISVCNYLSQCRAHAGTEEMSWKALYFHLREIQCKYIATHHSARVTKWQRHDHRLCQIGQTTAKEHGLIARCEFNREGDLEDADFVTPRHVLGSLGITLPFLTYPLGIYFTLPAGPVGALLIYTLWDAYYDERKLVPRKDNRVPRAGLALFFGLFGIFLHVWDDVKRLEQRLAGKRMRNRPLPLPPPWKWTKAGWIGYSVWVCFVMGYALFTSGIRFDHWIGLNILASLHKIFWKVSEALRELELDD